MAQDKIPVPDWINNLDEGAREKVVKLSILANERGGNESSICEEFSVSPAQAAAAISWVNQRSFSTASTSFLSGEESLKKNSGSTVKTEQQPSTVKTETPAPAISTRHELPKAASSRWGRSPRGEGRDRSTSKRKISSPKYRRRRKKSRMSTSMVSEITRLIIKVLQLKGAMTLEALAEQLCCKQEDVHNVLNVLTTTPLVNKVKLVTRKSGGQEEHSPAFAYRDGVPLEDNVEMSNLEQQLVKERNLTTVCKRRISTIRQELEKRNANAKLLLGEILKTDALILSDPLYRLVFKRCNVNANDL